MNSENYEFNQSQNQLILDLSKKMMFVSYFMIAGGALGVLAGLIAFARGGFGGVVQGVILLIVGFWTNNASKAFQSIVNTEGNDIENLMGALAGLRKLYTLQFWLMIISLVFMAIALITVFFIAASPK